MCYLQKLFMQTLSEFSYKKEKLVRIIYICASADFIFVLKFHLTPCLSNGIRQMVITKAISNFLILKRKFQNLIYYKICITACTRTALLNDYFLKARPENLKYVAGRVSLNLYFCIFLIFSGLHL